MLTSEAHTVITIYNRTKIALKGYYPRDHSKATAEIWKELSDSIKDEKYRTTPNKESNLPMEPPADHLGED